MAVELIGLAYNKKLAHDFWSSLGVFDLYNLVLEDAYRKRIDYRSMRYHTGQMQLISDIEELIYQNGETKTIYQIISQRFLKGIERSPFSQDFMNFDYQVIKYFASLATADNFIRSEKLFKQMLSLSGHLNVKDQWTFFDLEDYQVLFQSLSAFDFSNLDKLLQAEPVGNKEDGSHQAIKWLTHYNEFFNYSYNNQLNVFFYNNTSALKDWGDLLLRHNERNKTIVKSTFKFGSDIPKEEPCEDMVKLTQAINKKSSSSLQDKMKIHKESQYLMEGLDDYDPLVQQKSAESLCDFIFDGQYSDIIMQKFDEVDLPIKRELVRVLGKAMTPKVEAFLMNVLDSDESVDIQLLIAHELARYSSKNVVKKLLKKVLNGERHFAVTLGQIIQRSKNENIEALICDASQWKQETAYEELAYVLGLCRTDQAKISLMKLLDRQDDVKTQRNAMYALNKIDPRNIQNVLSNVTSQQIEILETKEILSQ